MRQVKKGSQSYLNPILGDAGNVIFGVVVSGITLCFIGFSVAHSSQKGILGSTNAIKRLVEISYKKERNMCRRHTNDPCEPVIGGCSYDQEKEYVFSWDKIFETDSKGLKRILKDGLDWIWDKIFKTDNTGTDSKRLKKIIKENYGLDWIDDNATIKKSDSPLTTTVTSNNKKKAFSIVLNDEELNDEELNDKEFNVKKKGDNLIVYQKGKSPRGFTPFFPWRTLPIIFMYAWVAIALYFVYIPISYFVDSFFPSTPFKIDSFINNLFSLAWLSPSILLKIVLVFILILIAVRFVIIVPHAETHRSYRNH